MSVTEAQPRQHSWNQTAFLQLTHPRNTIRRSVCKHSILIQDKEMLRICSRTANKLRL